MPNYIFRDKVLFNEGQRSFSSFLSVEAEAEAVVMEAEAEAEAVDRLAASTSLRLVPINSPSAP